jgi:CubicO group peptidase (beta-lactamase class C family)
MTGGAAGAHVRAAAQPPARGRPRAVRAADIAAVVDSAFAAGLPAERLPGGAFVFVQHGRVVYARGYGVANVATGQPVAVDSTLWRIGSISKTMTATAVVQLADRGRIRLDRDVNAYLRGVRVPETYPAPVTPWHLLTHTAGFDELRGRSAPTREAVQPLPQFLATRLVRLRPPGEIISYSSFGPALSGALVESVSGLAYEEYLKQNVWRPLGMTRTIVTPPGPLAAGYEVDGDSVVVAPWEWSHTAPAGMVNSTASDMGRFMTMLLGDHPSGARVLSARARTAMLTRQITMHPALPGVGLGLHENRLNGQVLFEHGGDVGGSATLMVLLPEHRAGFFVATHREGSRFRYALQRRLMDQLFPTADRPPTSAAGDASWVALDRFAGRYRWNAYCHTCPVPPADSGVAVAANGDGTLAFRDKRWVRVGPLLFASADGRERLAFRLTDGRPSHLLRGSFGVFERLP